MLASLLSVLGEFAATLGTQASIFFIMDEPEMPRALIEK